MYGSAQPTHSTCERTGHTEVIVASYTAPRLLKEVAAGASRKITGLALLFLLLLFPAFPRKSQLLLFFAIIFFL
jgi:hypothetical protein